MRCENCGFMNDPGVSACVKCGQPLSEQPAEESGNYYANRSSQPLDAELKKTLVQGAPTQEKEQLKKTVVQGGWKSSDDQTGAHEHATSLKVSDGHCPLCDYPMTGDFCANCGYEKNPKPSEELSDTRKDAAEEKFLCKCQGCGAEVSAKYRFCPECGSELDKGTINPFKGRDESQPAQPEHQCTLTLLNEEYNEFKDGETKEYEGSSIMLNRDNTDPGNRTITSKVQAELVYEEDGWSILNHSSYGATMVVANKKIRLEAGDVIVLGDRRFRFDVK